MCVCLLVCLFYFCTFSREIIDAFSDLRKKKKNDVGFLADTVQGKSFKLCVIITLIGIQQFMSHLTTLTIFHVHAYVGIKICTLFFLFLFTAV